MNDSSLKLLSETLTHLARGSYADAQQMLEANPELWQLRAAIGEVGQRLEAKDQALRETRLELERLNTEFDSFRSNVPGIHYIYVLQPDGTEKIPYISDSVRQYLHQEPSDIEADASMLTRLIHPDDRDALYASVEASAKSIEPWRYEFRYQIDGQIRWFDAMSCPTRQDSGDIVWYGVMLETTDRHEAQKALEASETRYRQLYESMIDAYGRADLSGTILEANGAFQELVGYSFEELKSLRYQDLTPPQWHAIDEQALRQVCARGFSDVYQKEYVRKDGKVVPVELRVFAVPGLDEEPSEIWAIVRDISARKALEIEMQLTQACVDKAAIPIFRVDDHGRILYANHAACDSLQYTLQELQALPVWEVDGKLSREEWFAHRSYVRATGSRTVESQHRRKDGSTFPVEITVTYINRDDQAFSVTFARDLSERAEAERHRRQLESQLIQAQKMESVGRLAGGVAHDFNNMLAVILGYTEMMKERLREDDPLWQDIVEIEKAGQHSREVTRQLLAFSRKQIISPITADLNDLVQRTQRTLSRLLGDDISLRFTPCEDLWAVHLDPHQVDQILLNLAVNARDAMPNGGILTITTSNLPMADVDTSGVVPAAEYVLLTVSDNGTGIEAEILDHIFDPFFTTKELGKGTGLGLATVYGIVKQNGGYIVADSSPGEGAAFRIYFPRKETLAAAPREEPAATIQRGRGTILLVEDEPMVRKITARMLESAGYKVIVAADPEHALSISKSSVQVDLLLSDVSMPGMNGVELAQHVKTMRPRIAVVFMSGYAEHELDGATALGGYVSFIQKPFDMKSLTEAVRLTLEAPAD